MEAHFRALGLPRGCTPDDVKKAYRQKALALHPDRNPSGTEEFKRVNMAYEALTTYFKQHGGRDIHAQPTSRGSAAPQHTDDEPLMSDAELFADVIPGGWQGRARQAPSQGRTGNSSTWANAAHRAAEHHRQRAHGPRAPVSSYDRGPAPSSSFAPPPPRSSVPPARSPSGATQDNEAFEERLRTALKEAMERQARNGEGPTAAEIHRIVEEVTVKTEATAARRNGGADRTGSRDATSRSTGPSHSTSEATREAAATTGNPSSRTGQQLHEQWRQAEKAMEEKLERLQQARRAAGTTQDSVRAQEAVYQQQRTHEEVARRQQAEAEARVQAKTRELQTKIAHLEEELAQLDRLAAEGERRESFARERRQLQLAAFRYQYSPDPGAVGDMSDVEVYLLTATFQRMNERLQRVLEARMARAPCCRCGLVTQRPKDPRSGTYFACTFADSSLDPQAVARGVQAPDKITQHVTLCQACLRVAKECPFCGAPPLVVPPSVPTATTSAARLQRASPTRAVPSPHAATDGSSRRVALTATEEEEAEGPGGSPHSGKDSVSGSGLSPLHNSRGAAAVAAAVATPTSTTAAAAAARRPPSSGAAPRLPPL